MQRHFVLLDACVASAHFGSKTTRSKNLRKRASALLSGTSSDVDVQFLIPNFCIAEVFAVLEKYRWGSTWNKHVKKENTLTQAEFSSSRVAFQKAIHNGAKILQVELNRYHILCVDLISPVNNAYKIKRSRAKTVTPAPAGTYDMLIAAMGIWLNHLYGKENFTIVTGDDRLTRVIERAKSVSLSKALKNHLSDVACTVGLTYSTDLYPEVINFSNCGKKAIEARFPGWSLQW